nr:TPA_exp: holocytochrome c synthase [Mesostigma viride]
MGNSSSNPGNAISCQSGPTSGCPSAAGQSPYIKEVYNVYGQRIDLPKKEDADANKKPQPNVFPGLKQVYCLYEKQQPEVKLDPKNQMPLEPNQQPAPGQKTAIPTERTPSTIPKGGTDSTWLYPSPQMFFNALSRKKKADDVREDDMSMVVAVHNNMNEMTWRKVLGWEALHAGSCLQPKLLRFLGKPFTLSPRARMWTWLGYEPPFDRHDWFVDRCGTEVRYVIDFYYKEGGDGGPGTFQIDARPALDSPEAFLDRTKMYIYTTFAKYGLPCPITGHPPTIAEGDGASKAMAGGAQQQGQAQAQQEPAR